MKLSLVLVFVLISVAVAGGKNSKESGNGKKPSTLTQKLEGNFEDAEVNGKRKNLNSPIAYLRRIFELFMGKGKDKRYKNINTYIGLRKVCNVGYVAAKTKAMDLFDFDGNGLVSNDEFVRGFAGLCINEDIDLHEAGIKLTKDHMPIFKAADINKDDSLDKQEFKAMIVPFCFQRMRKPIIAQLLQYDVNKDRAISKAEIIKMIAKADILPPLVHVLPAISGGLPPYHIWERIEEAFHSYDADRTGHLEKYEIFEWQLAAYRMKDFPSNLLKKDFDRSTIRGLEYEDDGDEDFDKEMKKRASRRVEL